MIIMNIMLKITNKFNNIIEIKLISSQIEIHRTTICIYIVINHIN